MTRSRNWRRSRLLAGALSLTMIAAACGGRDDSGGDAGGDSGGDTGGEEAAGGASIVDTSICADYQATAGVTDDTIKLGTSMPQSGPFAVFGGILNGLNAYFDYRNADGGIAGRQIELVAYDDEYKADRTSDNVKKLVEEDQVFALVSVLGTQNNVGVRDYLDEQCVPSFGVATGSPQWGEAAQYPWLQGGIPSYALEMKRLVDYLEEEQPDAKIALLRQNDDFGDAYENSLTSLTDANDMEVVAIETYDPQSSTDTKAQVDKLAQSDATVFVNGASGSQCPNTLKFVPDDWDVLTYVGITCNSKLSLSLAGGKEEGIISTQPTLDPANAEDQKEPAMEEFLTESVKHGLTQDDAELGVAAIGWGFGAQLAAIMEASPELTREDLMKTAWTMDGEAIGLMRPGSTLVTDGADDPWLLEALRVVKRTDGEWVEESPLKDYNGESNDFVG
ncbi:MAG: ABC transporter substrate-binding protein [Microthrixaceae bacterium]|nr:ABC transporter substrate-binding protein [Microthrixaceae bacterium]